MSFVDIPGILRWRGFFIAMVVFLVADTTMYCVIGTALPSATQANLPVRHEEVVAMQQRIGMLERTVQGSIDCVRQLDQMRSELTERIAAQEAELFACQNAALEPRAPRRKKNAPPEGDANSAGKAEN